MKSFDELPNTAVITTVYVMRHNAPILTVYHFEDGYWQFSSAEEDLPDEDYLVVALEEITSLDSSVLDVSDMPRRFSASRKNIKSKWLVTEEAHE